MMMYVQYFRRSLSTPVYLIRDMRHSIYMHMYTDILYLQKANVTLRFLNYPAPPPTLLTTFKNYTQSHTNTVTKS